MSPLSAKYRVIPFLVVFLLIGIVHSPATQAEYGDVMLNNFSDASGVRPVIFPHWFHRIRYSCKTCHSDLGFQMKAGANKINMLKIINGEYCGSCHDGKTAWAVDNCELCHSGKSKTTTHVDKGPQMVLPRYGKQ